MSTRWSKCECLINGALVFWTFFFIAYAWGLT